VTRALASLLDLSAQEVRGLSWATRAGVPPDRPLQGRVVAVLPFGHGALPAAAWLATAQRLGAGVIRMEDVSATAASGDAFEICREAVRWADILVTSHSLQGFARAVAADTGAPVVNAGERDGEDPAAGLSLIAAAQEAQSSDPGAVARRLHVAVCGNLRESRSAHGFLAGLAALEATVLLVPARGRDLPDDALQRLARRTGRRPLRFEARTMSSLLDMVDTVLLTPETAPQLPLFQELGLLPGEAEKRARREVEDTDVLFVAAGGELPDRLVAAPFRGRGRSVPEGIEHRTDTAALAALLRYALTGAVPEVDPAERGARLYYHSPLGLQCRSGGCVGARLPHDAPPAFLLLAHEVALLECLYCGARSRAEYVGSCEVGRYHAIGSADADRILDQNLVFFRTREEASAAGFEPSRRAEPPAGA